MNFSFRRFLSLVAGLLGFACCLPAAFAGIAFEQTVVVVPCAPGQAVVTTEIPFKVEGSQALSITQVRTSCNCTTGEADAPQYAPGSAGKLKVVFTVGERTGLQRKTLTVKTSDGHEQVVFFQTTVPAILEITPAFVFWRKGDKPEPKEIAVKVVYPQPVQVLDAKVNSGAFTVELVPVKAGQAYTLKITPKSTETAQTARIVLKSDFPQDDVERFVAVASVK